MQDTNSQSNYFPEKKPAGSVRSWSIEDVKQALRRRLVAAEQESDPEKQAEILRKTWPLIRTIRRLGFSLPTQTLVFAGCAMSAATVLLYLWLFPKTEWRVLEQISPYEFTLQRVVNGHPLLPEFRRFCQDFQPRFETGMTLSLLTFEDKGECISVAPPEHRYVIERDKNHRPKLAKGCFDPGDAPDFCIGPPQFD